MSDLKKIMVAVAFSPYTKGVFHWQQIWMQTY